MFFYLLPQKKKKMERRSRKGPKPATAWAPAYSMDNFSFILASQIRYLVANLTKKTFRANGAELEHVRLSVAR